MIKKTIVLVLSAFLIFSCSSNDETKLAENNSLTAIPLTYAKKFVIRTSQDFTVLELLGDKNTNQVTASFVLYKNQKPNYSKDAFYIKTPVNRVASMSSIYTTMLAKLNCEQKIVAIDNVDYYNYTFIQENVKSNYIIELSRGPQVEIEKTIALNPDLFLSFGMGNPRKDVDAKLVQANIPVAISLDHLEETPLARAEWIKFIAYFFDKQDLADSLFKVTENRYNQLKALTTSLTKKPTVLTEIKYGDAWYIPSGKSYMSYLINDAGGDYFWKDDYKTGSTPLTFEIVYVKAKDCDVWINQYNVNTKKELVSFDERYSLFKAFKEGHLFNNNKVQNALGYSNYWETGITNPDDILADLIAILHPSLLPNHQYLYYKKIE